MKQEWLSNTEYIQRCLAGDELLGDSFSQPDIDHWFKIEEQAYANMTKSNAWATKNSKPQKVSPGRRFSDNINRFHAFKKLPEGSF
jgi:hypothetical protein